MKKNLLNIEESEMVVLFDMDGTLTEARREIKREMLDTLNTVSKHAKIGIVSGSPIQYIRQQIPQLFEVSSLNKQQFILMPCNGTQAYSWNRSSKEFDKFYHVDFKSFLEEELRDKKEANKKYNDIINCLLLNQVDIIHKFPDINLAGNFISYRDSMINWSMIGRDASLNLRAKFENLDEEFNIRKTVHDSLRVHMNTSGLNAIECSLGGTTSIDIYPRGWDKTHCLQHVAGADVWFWGDRCTPGGNDFSLYDSLFLKRRSFMIESPEDCISSLRKNLPIDWYSTDILEGNLDIKSTTGSD